MANFELWIEILSLTKALFDAIKSGLDIAESYQRHKQEEDTIREAQRVSEMFTTYSEAELKDILRRLEDCRDRFIQQGSGQDRARCICSVLNEVMIGNGGQLPLIDDWGNIYRQLNCGYFLNAN
jgi:hypothetical protein